MSFSKQQTLLAGGAVGVVVVVCAAAAGWLYRDAAVISRANSADRLEDRLTAIDELASCTSGKAAAALEQLAGDDEPLAAARAIHVMGRCERRSRYREIVEGALDDERPGVRAAAVAAITYYDSPAALRGLREAMDDESEEVRLAAVRGLGRLDTWEAFGPMLDAMEDDSRRVRASAGAGVMDLAGRKYDFDASAPAYRRRRVVEQIRGDEPTLRQAYELYQQRRKDQEP